MPGVTSHRMDFHHNYGGINGHGGGYGIGQRNGYGGPDMDQNSMDRFENGRDPESTLELDHLATYSSKSVMKPEDGLRKLRGMESTTGIWTMRCIMIVEPKHLIVVDKGTLDELERFPLDLVYDPTAIFKEDRREVYTNLLLFSVLDKYNNRWDMHIFQSLKHPAQHIVDEILSAKEGRPIRGFSSIPPPPMGPAPDPPGGRWLGGTKEPKPHFSYRTDAENSPIVGRRDNVIPAPSEKHVRIVRNEQEQEDLRQNQTPVREHMVKERYIPLGSEDKENREIQRVRIPVMEKYSPIEHRKKMPTPPSNRRFMSEITVPQEEVRQRNAFSTIPIIEDDSSSRKYMTLESDRRNPREEIYSEMHVPIHGLTKSNRIPRVREHVVERRFVPAAEERRSSLGSRSVGTTSEGFSVSGIEEEEFDVPEQLLSRSRKNSSSSCQYRSSSADRYTLPGSHGNSVGSDGYAVPFDIRSQDRYGFPVRERRASTGGLEPSIYTQPRSRLSASSGGYNEVPRSRLSTSSVNVNEGRRSSSSSVSFNDVPIQHSRRGIYHSESDLQSAMRKNREPEYFPDSDVSTSTGRGRWKFGERRHQFSTSNHGYSSGYSSQEPSLYYSTLPSQNTKAKQSSRYHFKSTTMNEDSTKTDRFCSQNEGFRVIPIEGFRPPSEGFRTTPTNGLRDVAIRSQSPKDIYSLPNRDKDSLMSYGRTRDNRASFMDSSGQNEALERDVQFLNCCFDDIEKFVARLQQAAEAYKELENRRKERHQHKKKNDRGPPQKDGMLGMRARPPPGDDFIDIFQKIKWAFNLLAKLKAHIHDPNAPELVHFIFTPLSLIYEASRDPYHQGVDLASKAVSPLLTRDAKELLLNCLTSKELELWQLLGRNWTTSEDESQSPLNKPYLDKNQLEQSLANHKQQIEENTRAEEARYQIQNKLPTPRENGYRDYGRSENNRPPVEQRYNENEGHYVRNIGNISRSYRPDEEVEPYRPVEPMYDQRKRPSTPPPPPVTNPDRYHGYMDKHVDSSMEPQRSFPNDRARSNANYKEELRRKNAKIYEAVHERTGRNQKEITVEKGDILEVLDDSRNWWRLKNFKGESGYAPYTILRDVIDDRNDMDRNLNDTMDLMYLNGHHRGGSFGGYSGNINQSNHHIPVAPPPPRKDEEEFERVIKQSSPGRQDSDDSDRYRRDRRRDRPSNGRYSRDLTPDSSDPENFSGSFDGRSNNSREDIVERRGKSRDRYEKPRNYHDGRGRNSLEVKQGGGYHNQSFEDDSPMRRAKSPPPPPPSFVPPPPPESRPIADNKKNPMYGQVEKRADRDELHNELSRRLTGKPISIPKAKPVLLSTRSTQKEVAEWLQAKSFSQRCINALRGMNGQQLLRSKMKDLERLVGHDEAQRLDGHLTLLKNKTGYKTQGPKELQAILQQRKQMAETYGDEVGKPPSFAPDSPDYSDDNSEVQEITTDFDKMLSHY